MALNSKHGRQNRQQGVTSSSQNAMVRKCPQCGGTDIDSDATRGDDVCMNCGQVSWLACAPLCVVWFPLCLCRPETALPQVLDESHIVAEITFVESNNVSSVVGAPSSRGVRTPTCQRAALRARGA